MKKVFAVLWHKNCKIFLSIYIYYNWLKNYYIWNLNKYKIKYKTFFIILFISKYQNYTNVIVVDRFLLIYEHLFLFIERLLLLLLLWMKKIEEPGFFKSDSTKNLWHLHVMKILRHKCFFIWIERKVSSTIINSTIMKVIDY